MCLAIPGRVVAVEGADDLNRRGRVDFSGVVREVSFSLVPGVNVDDWVLVHAGFALNLIDREEAERTLAELRELGELGGGLLDGDEFDRRGAADREREPGDSHAPSTGGSSGAGP